MKQFFNLPIKWIKLEMRLINFCTIQIVITDSGFGISKDIVDKILLPFFSTKPVNTGTGLGLSISRKIIENHRGKLYLEEDSTNTCFIIELPIE